ncbi:hypothetical protein GCWU000324_01674 [Kingella oralis ATCC 51147]|uniref:Uncharacterized protein n=1 Tax=Kingella oralis ATCC 51147 TaxID=629741 RepID=C4GL18_9NEIS|nr:hypothetical protein GCWU000324_01674 [Kingella oralis ATCC 51147]
MRRIGKRVSGCLKRLPKRNFTQVYRGCICGGRMRQPENSVIQNRK